MHQEHRDPMEGYHDELREPIDFTKREHHLLDCPNCSHFIKADDINIDKAIAKCSNCDHVFSFDSSFGHHGDAYSRPDMLIPEGLEVLKLRSELDLQVNWWRNSSKTSIAFQLTFTLIWNLILLPFVVTAIASGQLSILLFTSLHLIVGVYMLLRMMALFVNTTHINVTKKAIEWRSSPMSMFGKKRKIPASDIKQLYVSKYVASRTNGRPNYAYALHLITRQGRKLSLLKGMNLETQRYMEYEIESFLHIKDARVKNELPKAATS